MAPDNLRVQMQIGEGGESGLRHFTHNLRRESDLFIFLPVTR
jgi:hypothetical protein